MNRSAEQRDRLFVVALFQADERLLEALQRGISFIVEPSIGRPAVAKPFFARLDLLAHLEVVRLAGFRVLQRFVSVRQRRECRLDAFERFGVFLFLVPIYFLLVTIFCILFL